MADSWEPWDDGFVSPETTDAPIDGQIIIAANHEPEAFIVAGPGASTTLETVLLTGVGSNYRAAVLPPPGGWEPLGQYTIEFETSARDGVNAQLDFVVGSSSAAAVPTLEVEAPVVGEWSDDGEHYPWGCCTRTRTVTVDAHMPGADPWDRVELVGLFELGRPSQITTTEVHTHLWVEVGEGPNTLALTQWMDDDGTVEPPCFDVVAVSAAGEVGASESFCVDDPYLEPGTASGGAGCGCDQAPPTSVVAGVLGALARRR